jgi:hypothetical protein
MKTKSIAAGAILMVLAFFISCSSIENIRDTRALHRITASRPLMRNIIPFIDSLWPHKIDATTQLIKGGVDSIPYAVLVPLSIDSAEYLKLRDSIAKVTNGCGEAVINGYTNGFNYAKSLFSNIKIPVPRPDTLKKTTVNTRDLDLCREDLIAEKVQTAIYKSKSDDYKSERNILFFIVLGLVAGLGASLFIKLRPKI